MGESKQLSDINIHELRHTLGKIKNAAFFINKVLEAPLPEVAEMLQILQKESTKSADLAEKIFKSSQK